MLSQAQYEPILLSHVGTRLQIGTDGSVWRIATLNKKGDLIAISPRRTEVRHNGGYLHVDLSVNKHKYRAMAHRLVWAHFNGPIPPGMEINHKDGDKTNNHPSNLELVTPQENTRHSIDVLKTTRAPGIKNANAKLTNDQVREIRSLAATHSQSALGRQFGVHQGVIWRIINYKAWTHV